MKITQYYFNGKQKMFKAETKSGKIGWFEDFKGYEDCFFEEVISAG